jgi:endonuclease-3
MSSLTAERKRALEVLAILGPLWPDAKPLLHYDSCFQLCCAVALSAQCTDEQVNRTTPGLFARWPDAASMAKADVREVENTIRSLGFFRTKARHLVETARLLVERHQGRIPETMEELLELPGIGRKSANLIRSACFGKAGIIVDTHVLRTAVRLGFYPRPLSTSGPDPEILEKHIASLLPPELWTRFSHAVNRHGKHVCKARKPDCMNPDRDPCPLLGLCPRKGMPQKGLPRKGLPPLARQHRT